MMQDGLIESLRDTQHLLEGRFDEIDTLTGIVRLIVPEIEADVFFQEFAELLFSRNNVESIAWFTYENGLRRLLTIGCFDNEPKRGGAGAPEDALIAAKNKEVHIANHAVYIPLVFADSLAGVIALSYPEKHEISPFSTPFYYLMGAVTTMALRMIDERKRLKDRTELLSKENKMLKEIIVGLGEQENSFVFRSSAMNALIERADRVKNLDVDLLVSGESGTGKDLVTRYIHYSSIRKNGPFIAVNCAAIPESLVEGELFGIEEGVATGVKKRKGKFEMAHGGTIFLDEIGELAPVIQAKLLRFLQDKMVTPIGSSEERKIDVKVVAATNRDLVQLIKDGRFREDLYYRLSSFPLHIPPLRERREDQMPLFLFFFRYFSKKYDKQRIMLHPRIEEAIALYHWPGNVREMKNRVTQAIIIVDDGGMITPELLGIAKGVSFEISDAVVPKKDEPKIINIREWLMLEQRRIERRAFVEALKSADGVKSKAAEILDISLRTFHYKFKELGIADVDYKE